MVKNRLFFANNTIPKDWSHEVESCLDSIIKIGAHRRICIPWLISRKIRKESCAFRVQPSNRTKCVVQSCVLTYVCEPQSPKKHYFATCQNLKNSRNYTYIMNVDINIKTLTQQWMAAQIFKRHKSNRFIFNFEKTKYGLILNFYKK